MAFSGGVKLGDLDDIIGLEQECVKPLIQAAEGGNAKLDSSSADIGRGKRVKAVEVAPLVKKPDLIKKKKSGDTKDVVAQVSLSDCLACSGCVTSAETVLLQEQSGEEFIKRAATSPVTVVTVSAEARTNLANHLGLEPLPLMLRLAAVLRRFGVTYVVENSAAEAVALLEGKFEFVKRFKAMPEHSSARGAKLASKSDSTSGSPMPLLTSHCPGWTLYAEKVVDPSVLPHLAPLRPPQHIQGRLVKTRLLEAHNRRRLHQWWRTNNPLFACEVICRDQLPRAAAISYKTRAMRCAHGVSFEPMCASDVYHVSVQPCFDKKIEAARPSFQVSDDPEQPGVREVDTVLTTTELLDLLRGAGGNVVPEVDDGAEVADVLAAVSPVSLNGEVLTDLGLGDLRKGRPQPLLCVTGEHGGSGGFLEHIFREAALELFSINVPSLVFTTKQNEDMREVLLEDPESKRVLLRFVTAYGFRNIQNIIKRLTKPDVQSGSARAVPSASECGQFVEIMACPGGCLNGGGQIPAAKEKGQLAQAERRARLAVLEDVLCRGEGTAMVPPDEHPDILDLYRYISTRSSKTRTGSTASDQPLERLVGGEAVQSWLSAEWRSLKVDSDGKEVVASSALKW